MIWNSPRSPSTKQYFLSTQTPFHPHAAPGVRLVQDQVRMRLLRHVSTYYAGSRH